ncbi:cactin-like protein, partial [Euroglyphus maynei]
MTDNNDDRRFKDERRRQKEMIKALETPEQKRQRRLAKKNEKEQRRKRLMGWDEEYMGYTNDDNPFGDSNLHETFVWKKKYEKMGMKRIDEQEIDAVNKEKMIKNRQELEKVKKRRLERERERELRMEELSKQQRDKEAEQFKEWSKQEDYFHLKQARLRSKLRIKEGRAKPIDILAQYINVFGENQTDEQKSEMERMADEEASSDSSRLRQQQQRRDEEEEDLHDKIRYLSTYLSEPYNTLNGLRIRDMEDLVEDIKIYLELDSGSKVNAEYWKDLQIIVDDELTKLKLANMDQQERRREGINPSVSADIARILKGKSPQQLKTLQIQIEKKIASREEGIDIGYWETLLSRLKAQISRARLREFHEENLKKRKTLIAQHQQNIKDLQPQQSLDMMMGENDDDDDQQQQQQQEDDL